MPTRLGRQQRSTSRSSRNMATSGIQQLKEDKVMPAYRDFSQISAHAVLRIVDPPKAKRKGPRGGVQIPFPVRLFDMLDACEKEGKGGIVAWQPHGRSFSVLKPKVFQSKILPKFFSQSKNSSFQRQLNLYGFLRHSTGADRGSYYHELFLRSRPDLPPLMVRTRVKGVGMGRALRVEQEPDFYSMPPCVPGADSVPGLEEPETEPIPEIPPSPPSPPSPRSTSPTVLMHSQSTPPPRNVSELSEAPCVPPTHGSWTAASDHPKRVSPAFTSVVTPVTVHSRRRIFWPSPSPCAADLHKTSCFYEERAWSRPIRALSSQLPMIPLDSRHPGSPYSLEPRYHGWSHQDTALFEGLEFQVVDDDSLEQFEADLIPNVHSP